MHVSAPPSPATLAADSRQHLPSPDVLRPDLPLPDVSPCAGSVQDDATHVDLTLTVSDLSAKIEQYRAHLEDESRERRRLEEVLIDLSEREQARIGRELHDGIGQTLTGIAFLAKALHTRLREHGSTQADNAAWITRLVNEATEQVRFLARGLSPAALDAPDLHQALIHLADDVKRIYGVAVALDLPETAIEWSAEEANHLLRIAQEAVNNALRHGRARRIHISLARKQGNIRFAIRDDGGGFSQGELKNRQTSRPGVGLQSMRVRAELVRAGLRIRSGARGTAIIVSQANARPALPVAPG